jgi:hypothetical protein
MASVFDIFSLNDDHDAPVNLDPKNMWCIHGKRYDLRMHDFFDRHPGTASLTLRGRRSVALSPGSCSTVCAGGSRVFVPVHRWADALGALARA